MEEILFFRTPVLPVALERFHLDVSWYRRDRFALATLILTVAIAALTPSIDERRPLAPTIPAPRLPLF